jgi:hypothetical protein
MGFGDAVSLIQVVSNDLQKIYIEGNIHVQRLLNSRILFSVQSNLSRQSTNKRPVLLNVLLEISLNSGPYNRSNRAPFRS